MTTLFCPKCGSDNTEGILLNPDHELTPDYIGYCDVCHHCGFTWNEEWFDNPDLDLLDDESEQE